MSRHDYTIYPGSWPLVAESRELNRLPPGVIDELWAVGWRHFGAEFFRASLMADELGLKRQIALRIRVPDFARSKSQRRTIRRNGDLEWRFAPANPGVDESRLFASHKQRFQRNVPDRLEDFLGQTAKERPCEFLQLSVLHEERLVAASFVAVGENSCSSVYAVFDPAFSRRRLGIFTMLVELEFASLRDYEFYYSGYATIEPSCYDYKKQFRAMEYYDWEGRWVPLEELPL